MNYGMARSAKSGLRKLVYVYVFKLAGLGVFHILERFQLVLYLIKIKILKKYTMDKVLIVSQAFIWKKGVLSMQNS
jgi:hypothetical protein